MFEGWRADRAQRTRWSQFASGVDRVNWGTRRALRAYYPVQTKFWGGTGILVCAHCCTDRNVYATRALCCTDRNVYATPKFSLDTALPCSRAKLANCPRLWMRRPPRLA